MKTVTKIINVAYCIGAAVVIFGAWAKILHHAGANFFLTLGLLTEVVIFVIYGFMEGFTEPPTDAQQTATFSSDTGELTQAVKETNTILRNIFKVNK